MTDPAASANDNGRSFVQLWAESIASVLGQIASATFPVEEKSAEGQPAAAQNDLYMTITASGTVRGEMSLHLPQATALELAKLFMSDTDAAHVELTADDRSAVEELFRQIAGHVSTSARAVLTEIPIDCGDRRNGDLVGRSQRLDLLDTGGGTASADRVEFEFGAHNVTHSGATITKSGRSAEAFSRYSCSFQFRPADGPRIGRDSPVRWPKYSAQRNSGARRRFSFGVGPRNSRPCRSAS